MDKRKSALLVMGSLRAGRVCPRIAHWVAGVGLASAPLDIEIIDLEQWPLPMHDEPAIPATGIYGEPHTRAWSAKVSGADAVIFVTPQYNWGYPAALKNAIDHLYREWRDKPTMLVTYGGHGGTKCAEQLRQVLGAVKARLVPTCPALVLPDGVIRAGESLDPPHDFLAHENEVRAAFAQLNELLVASEPG